MGGEQDMRNMGGLRKKIPWTFGTFSIGTLAIAGIPFLAGYYSKDEILAAALAAENRVLFGLGLFTAVLTAFYMARLLFMTFFGSYRGEHEPEHVHESPWTMLGPLVILAAGCFVVGHLHVPQFVHPVFRLPGHGEVWHRDWLPYVATSAAVGGIVVAAYFYLVFTNVPGKIAARFQPLHRLFAAKYYFDDLYDGFAKRVVVDGSTGFLWRHFDVRFIDGIVNGLGSVTEALSRRVRLVQTGLVRGYALVTLGGAVALVGYLLWL
jgi:NADH-quinone oxidoreductase subunit L